MSNCIIDAKEKIDSLDKIVMTPLGVFSHQYDPTKVANCLRSVLDEHKNIQFHITTHHSLNTYYVRTNNAIFICVSL